LPGLLRSIGSCGFTSTDAFSGRSEGTIRVSGNMRANNSEMLREVAIAGRPSADIEAGRLRAVLTDWEANPGNTGTTIHLKIATGLSAAEQRPRAGKKSRQRRAALS
jgi:hypothetical protein